jgi:lysyl-tRNA synthetase class 2
MPAMTERDDSSTAPARSPWWAPHVHADRRPFLMARNAIKAAIRHHLEADGFVEVDAGLLQVSPGNETHLHAFATELVGTDLARRRLYLPTSPEFAMKKLLAAGERRIHAFAPAFRNRERGALHAPEFTMLEWYRVEAPYEALWADAAAFLALAAGVTGRHHWQHRGSRCDVTRPPVAVSVDEAFTAFAGIRLEATYGADEVDVAALKEQSEAAGIRTAADDTWSDIFSRVMVERIEPRLGDGRPTILHSYPVHEAALAQRKPGVPRVAERFELYVAGLELANGFGELTDPVEQRRRLDAEMAEKARIYAERYPIDDDFISALAAMPAASGCALGFERLVMLATAAPSVDHVIWTPLSE